MRSRIFFITYIAANLSLVAYGVLVLVSPAMLVDSFMQRVYAFPPVATDAVAYLAGLFRLLGFFNLILGSLGLLLLWQVARGRARWIVNVVIASSLLAYLGPIVFDNTVGNVGVFEIIELALFIAMLLSGIVMLAGRAQAGNPGGQTTEMDR